MLPYAHLFGSLINHSSKYIVCWLLKVSSKLVGRTEIAGCFGEKKLSAHAIKNCFEERPCIVLGRVYTLSTLSFIS